MTDDHRDTGTVPARTTEPLVAPPPGRSDTGAPAEPAAPVPAGETGTLASPRVAQTRPVEPIVPVEAADAEPTTPEPAAGEPPDPEAAGRQPVADEPADQEPAGRQPARTQRDAVAPVRARVSGAGALIGLLLLVLGFALVAQARNTNTDSQLATARPEDLVRILSDLESREERLRRELAELEESKRQLDSGAQGREAALAEARRRAEVLGILAGTLPAEGSGLEVVFAPRDQRIKAESILDAVEELRGAGAEVMQISGAGGTPVRIVASSFFVDSGDGIAVDGAQMSAPYTIQVIGDPLTMQPALTIPGGVVDAVRQRGGNVTMRQPPVVRVDALHNSGPLKHARPVS